MAGSKKVKRSDAEEEKYDMAEEKKVVHRHPNPPTYYPSDDRYAIELNPETYRPRDLLNLSVKTFWLRLDEELNLRQLNARKGFCGEYEKGLRLFDCNVGGDGQQLARQQQCVNELKRYIDEFFFFEQLRRRVDLTSGIDVVKATEDGLIQADWNGHTQLRAGRCRLRINIGRGDRAFPLLAVVETLVHEMAHAYLLVFSDLRCAACRQDRLNTVGLEGDGHGPVFLQLHRLMVTEVRGWDAGLRQLAADDCAGRFRASQKARQLADEAYRGLSRKERLLYTKPRAPGRGRINKPYIRETVNWDVIVDKDWVAKSLTAEEEDEKKRLQRDDEDVEALNTMMNRQSINQRLGR